MGPPARAKPSILVLCDDDLLHQIIALCLRDCTLHAAPLSTRKDPSRDTPHEIRNTYDLIILALGASRAEPLVALARACLLDCIGTTPLLVVSRRPFQADTENGIYHMPFPFDTVELGRQVERLVVRH